MGDLSDTWRQAGPVLKSDDTLDEPLLKRLEVLPSTFPNEQQKRDLIKFYIYYNKAAVNLYSDGMSARITQVNRTIPYDMPGRLQLSTLVGTYMSGRPAHIHPDHETITKLSHMYNQIMTRHSGRVNHDTVKTTSDEYDGAKKGGSLKHKKKRPRPTNKRNPSRKRIRRRRRRSMKYKK
jgi:hypothetical protein